MPSEMQTRIARAIYEVDPCRSGPTWDSLTAREQSEYHKTALAAMRAMREPTPVMLSVGDHFAFYSRGIWRAMLYAEIAAAAAGDSHDR